MPLLDAIHALIYLALHWVVGYGVLTRILRSFNMQRNLFQRQ